VAAVTESNANVVLAVDDEPEILESIKRTLRREPYRVITTVSPLEALSLLEAGGIDVLLADIDMPEMNGLELVRRARAACPETVRLLLTGDASLDSALTAINDGEVHRYLLKPWDKEDLRGVIRHALERLEELRRGAQADRRVAAREILLSELERAHPGIRDVATRDGAYALDERRITESVLRIDTVRLRALFGVLSEASGSVTRRIEDDD
jgi:response regulator RpfG family c-di-GMP phosphodiesterase